MPVRDDRLMPHWTPDDLAAYEARRVKQIGSAQANHADWKSREAARWNGNVEPVKITSGGVESRHASGAKQRTDESPPSPHGGSRLAGVAPGPLTHLYPLVSMCHAHGLPLPVPEHRFHPTRKWRFDYSWPLKLLALEVEGGVWTQGRHTRGSGAIADMQKYSEAAILGWRLLYVTPDELTNGVAIDRIRRALSV